MKTKLEQARIKAQKKSSCGMCKPWKRGWEDKKTVRDVKQAQRDTEQLKDL